MRASSLVSFVRLSPNRTSPRSRAIDTITVHCVVGQLSVETIGALFAPKARRASANYGVGADGRVGLYCGEEDRSWCSSSRENDHRAVTIETACELTAPYAVRPEVYESLIRLCADICRRNGKRKLVWVPEREAALAREPAEDEMRMTVHRWFAATACPGQWLMEHMEDLARRVNGLLTGENFAPYTVRVRRADLRLRAGPGTDTAARGTVPPGVYTIVAEASGAGAGRWGRLKSGAGWIALDYTERME